MRSLGGALLAAASLAGAGCNDGALVSADAAVDAHAGAADLATRDAALDLSIHDAPLDAALDAPLDAAPVDAAIVDAATDAAFVVDGAADLLDRDALPCRGGYNAADPATCPLACSPLVTPVADEGAIHIPFGTLHTYAANPPASGPHWPAPAPWGRHDEVVPREWWVHNLEHGGVVFLYNCPAPDGGTYDADAGAPIPNDCPDVIAAFSSLMAAWPQDDWYDALFETRILITPDPYLPGRLAAVAWDWSYVTSTVDTAALDCFLRARYGHGPENAP